MYVGSWLYPVVVDWLVGGRSECKLVINCKKGAGFKWAKGLGKYGICHQRRLTIGLRDLY